MRNCSAISSFFNFFRSSDQNGRAYTNVRFAYITVGVNTDSPELKQRAPSETSRSRAPSAEYFDRTGFDSLGQHLQIRRPVLLREGVWQCCSPTRRVRVNFLRARVGPTRSHERLPASCSTQRYSVYHAKIETRRYRRCIRNARDDRRSELSKR